MLVLALGFFAADKYVLQSQPVPEAESPATSASRSSTSIVLPRLLDILRPSLSTVKPWVSTDRNGLRPVTPSAGSIDSWNQPRC